MAKEKPRWTHWEKISYAENWRKLVQHEVRRLWSRGEMSCDNDLKRWAGIPLQRNGEET